MGLFGKKIRIGDVLRQEGLITEEQLVEALAEQKRNGTKLGETLMAMGYVTEADFTRVICRLLCIEPVDLRKTTIDERVLKIFDVGIMRKYEIIPFAYDETNMNIIKVAMSDPLNALVINEISLISNLQIQPYYATSSHIRSQLDKIFYKKTALETEQQYTAEQDKETQEDGSTSEDATIIKIVRSILQQAVKQGASGIHVEPMEKSIRIRYRIDGVLHESMDYSISLLPAMTARIKLIAGLDIAEKRKPQEGRLTLHVDGIEYDVRISTLPTVFGEKAVMHLAPKQALIKEREYLNLSTEDGKKLDDILNNTSGIVLVAGPSDSGISTTCYTLLSELNTEDVSIVTVEDPIETNVEGIYQVQVNPKADLTYASALESILHQDADIIMIGEIRDSQTASLAVRAAVTGHLVITSVHTNFAAAAITQLVDMGVEPYLLGSSLAGIVAQRLVRRLCPHCKVSREASETEKRLLGVPLEQRQEIYEPCGCQECGKTGYKGRIALYEVMSISQKMGMVIHKGASAEEIHAAAVSEGMHTLRMAGVRNVLEGNTSLVEMMKTLRGVPLE